MSNKHKYRVIYNTYQGIDANGGLHPVVYAIDLEWADGLYDECISYQDNLDYVVSAIFEDGFLESGTHYIAANAILAIEACEVSVQPQQRAPQGAQHNQNGDEKSNKRFKRRRRYQRDSGGREQASAVPDATHQEQATPPIPTTTIQEAK